MWPQSKIEEQPHTVKHTTRAVSTLTLVPTPMKQLDEATPNQDSAPSTPRSDHSNHNSNPTSPRSQHNEEPWNRNPQHHDSDGRAGSTPTTPRSVRFQPEPEYADAPDYAGQALDDVGNLSAYNDGDKTDDRDGPN
jgi:hypothetical protein